MLIKLWRLHWHCRTQPKGQHLQNAPKVTCGEQSKGPISCPTDLLWTLDLWQMNQQLFWQVSSPYPSFPDRWVGDWDLRRWLDFALGKRVGIYFHHNDPKTVIKGGLLEIGVVTPSPLVECPYTQKMERKYRKKKIDQWREMKVWGCEEKDKYALGWK